MHVYVNISQSGLVLIVILTLTTSNQIDLIHIFSKNHNQINEPQNQAKQNGLVQI